MHACEMSDGNLWGKKTAEAAVNALSRLDLVGVMSYQYDPQKGNWVFPLQEVGDKRAVTAAIDQMDMGDLPAFGPLIDEAYAKLKATTAGQKHIIIISDGDPSPPTQQQLTALKSSGITVSTVAYFAHGTAQAAAFAQIAQATGGRHYDVTDPNRLPQIFIKEAQVVRRALIVEDDKGFALNITDPLGEVIRGIDGVPKLKGYILTGPAGGLSRILLKSAKDDPILATGQFGLGRVVAFTSTASSKEVDWGDEWAAWPGSTQIWQQAVRWASKSAGSGDCEIFADVQDRNVDVTVEAVETNGVLPQLGSVAGEVISPDMATKELPLAQVGPGRYHATFQAAGAGSYLLNLQYTKAGELRGRWSRASSPCPTRRSSRTFPTTPPCWPNWPPPPAGGCWAMTRAR